MFLDVGVGDRPAIRTKPQPCPLRALTDGRKRPPRVNYGPCKLGPELAVQPEQGSTRATRCRGLAAQRLQRCDVDLREGGKGWMVSCSTWSGTGARMASVACCNHLPAWGRVRTRRSAAAVAEQRQEAVGTGRLPAEETGAFGLADRWV